MPKSNRQEPKPEVTVLSSLTAGLEGDYYRRQQVIVVWMHLEQRLRTEQKHLVVRQRETRAVRILGNRWRRILRADPRQQDVIRQCS